FFEWAHRGVVMRERTIRAAQRAAGVPAAEALVRAGDFFEEVAAVRTVRRNRRENLQRRFVSAARRDTIRASGRQSAAEINGIADRDPCACEREIAADTAVRQALPDRALLLM